MSKGENFEVIEGHCTKNEWNKIKRISIYYEETKLLKWIPFIASGFSFHRTYFLKITYKNKEIKTIRILPKEKNVIKPYITPFNFMLNGLIVSQEIKI